MTALLHDKQAQKHVLVAVTHLKAKAGADNEQMRVHQVGCANSSSTKSACTQSALHSTHSRAELKHA